LIEELDRLRAELKLQAYDHFTNGEPS